MARPTVSVDGSLGSSRELEEDLLARLRVLALDTESGEGLERQDWVGAGAALKEGSGEGKDLGALEGGVEGRRCTVLAEEARDQGLVAGLHGDNGPAENGSKWVCCCDWPYSRGSSQIGLVVNKGSLVEVGADTDTLEDAGSLEELGNCVVVEVVGLDRRRRSAAIAGLEASGTYAGLSGRDTKATEDAREGNDVGSLLRADLGKTLGHGSRVAGVLEVVGAEAAQGVLVEGSLKMLEGERVLKDVDILLSGFLGGDEGGGSSDGADEDGGVFHVDGEGGIKRV